MCGTWTTGTRYLACGRSDPGAAPERLLWCPTNPMPTSAATDQRPPTRSQPAVDERGRVHGARRDSTGLEIASTRWFSNEQLPYRTTEQVRILRRSGGGDGRKEERRTSTEEGKIKGNSRFPVSPCLHTDFRPAASGADGTQHVNSLFLQPFGRQQAGTVLPSEAGAATSRP